MATQAVRVTCKCRACKHAWIEDGTVEQRRDNRGLRYLELVYGTGLKHRCERIETVIADRSKRELTPERQARLGQPGYISVDRFLAELADSVTNGFILRKVLKTTLSEDVPCDARCTSAHGPNCECSCGGKQHGRDTTP
jgi:hypothetical protein